MQHLHDFFDRHVRGRATALLYDDGFRRWSYSYAQVRATAHDFANRLMEAGVLPGHRLVIWSGNRAEWVPVFWGCMLRGVAVIPLDARTPVEQVRGILLTAAPRAIVVGDDIQEPPVASPSLLVWRLADVAWIDDDRLTTLRAGISANTIAEIVFTSGSTGEPKGVVITHGNIVANIAPIERAAARYRRYLWPLRPIRFLGLLPLSHMFGQALALFLPPLVSAGVVFTRGYSPAEIVRQIRRNRITLAVTVPRVLDLLRLRLRHLLPSAHPSAAPLALTRRLWRHRAAHRLFGWKFCGFVVGGAALDNQLEAYWRGLGFVVVQGYGLTETAPIVAWNDPFRTRQGTVGMPLEGVEVRIALDGEVLVRGPSVTTGYLRASGEMQSAFEGGWLHTGDLGSLDASGHLLILGRKKDVIVTSEGVHVFPEEVEQILETVDGVREAAVVARADGGERVHAVLVVEPDTDAAAVIRRANTRLGPDQRIRDFSIWPGRVLPRTDALRKLKRYEIRQWVAEGSPRGAAAMPPAADNLEQLLARYVHNQPVGAQTTLNELGLSSLDRVELAITIEEQAGVSVSEAAVAKAATVGDLRRLMDEALLAGPDPDVLVFPRWTRSLLARAVRNVSQALWILPLAHAFLRLRVSGREHLAGIRGPVIFAANHQSHLDTPAILLSVPVRWRRRMAVAMAKEFFDAHFFPERHGLMDRVTAGTLYGLAVLFFNAFPLPRRGAGARDSLRYAGELATAGWSILVFPEGHRTERGEINSFQPGVGMMASRLRLPVVPVRLEGLDRVLHHTWRWPSRGFVHVTFGAPLHLEGEDYAALARTVEQAVIGSPPAKAARPDAA